MINEKNKRQSMDDQRMQKATINISGIPEDDADELLTLQHQMIRAERKSGRRMQKGYFAVNESKTSK